MEIQAAQCSCRGSRAYNEDAVFHTQLENGFIAVVADGLGGCGGGDVASQLVVKTFSEQFWQNPELTEENLRHIFECTNQRVLEGQQAGRRMKSTVVALFCRNDNFAIAHMGDSRLYRFRHGKLTFRTRDHSVSQMAVLSGEITERQVRFHEDRNKVLRALGGEETVRPEISGFSLDKTQEAVLLCTDGFWEYVWEDEMEADLAKSDTPDQWLSYMIARIGRRMTKKNDNFSAVALFVHA